MEFGLVYCVTCAVLPRIPSQTLAILLSIVNSVKSWFSILVFDVTYIIHNSHVRTLALDSFFTNEWSMARNDGFEA